MDPATRYQCAVDELHDAAWGFLHPVVYRQVANTVTTLARMGDVAPPQVRVAPVTEERGDPLVP